MILCRLDRWELNRPCSSHIYRGGGLIPIGNLSKPYFPSFPRVWNSSDRNPKGQIRTGFSVRYVGSPVGSPDLGRNSLQSELLTFVGTPDVGITLDTRADFFRLSGSSDTHVGTSDGRKSRLRSELPTTKYLSKGITSSSRLRIRRSTYVFLTVSMRGTQW